MVTDLVPPCSPACSAGRQLAVQGIDRGARVRRVVQNAVRNDEVEALVGERQIHEVCLHDGAILQVPGIAKSRKGTVRDINCKDLSRTVLGDEPRVEPGSRSDFKDTPPRCIKTNQLTPAFRQAEFPAIPSE